MRITAEEYREMTGSGATQAKRQQGHTARHSGLSFEATLDKLHKLWIMQGRAAVITKQHPDMRAVWQGGRLVYILTDKGPCDYVFILRSGRSGVFDAKSTGNKGAFTWPKNQEHQLVEMTTVNHTTTGYAASFALVEWRAVGEVRLHHCHTIEDRRVRRDDGILIDGYDWIDAVGRM